MSIHGKVRAGFWWWDAPPHTDQLGLGKRRGNLEDMEHETISMSQRIMILTHLLTYIPIIPINRNAQAFVKGMNHHSL